MQKYKDKFLGMPFGTANNQLKKSIMFHLVKQLNQNHCYRCSEEIVDLKDFSIDHKLHWQGEDIKLFWDLNNIAYSHLECNRKASRYFTEARALGNLVTKQKLTIKCPENKFRCSDCKQFKEIYSFALNKTKPKGIQTECRECRAKTRKRGK